jgi:OmpA-OmpF porin, OOP family
MKQPVLLLALIGSSAFAQLQTPPVRISDPAIQSDLQGYQKQQARIKALNDSGKHKLADYAMAKSQCWLDVSFHEYTRNDRGPFPQAALDESAKLTAALEQGKAPDLATPLVGEAVRLREDLWARTAALKQHAGFACAQAKTACAEVELVHAGNEHAQFEWRHARPYVQLAEELTAEAEALAAACLPAPVAKAAPLPVPVPVAPMQELALAVELVFAFDKDAAGDIRPAGRAQLDEVLARLRREGWTVKDIALSGHADRLNSTGKSDYNQRLSERRVATVRALLVQAGIPDALMRSEAAGDTRQTAACDQLKPGPELRECLLPNRRVEVRVNASRQARPPR